MLRGVIPVMLECPECGWSNTTPESIDDNMIKYWYPVLFGFYDIIMNGEDLEVRRLYVTFLCLRIPALMGPTALWIRCLPR
jgi:Sec7-like guanine-nucleotide exchange factor